jgi:hypothetical protein
MTKKADAKTTQGFNKKPIWPTCGKCSHYSEGEKVERGYVSIINQRCGLGKFKVGKSNTCLQHESKIVYPNLSAPSMPIQGTF